MCPNFALSYCFHLFIEDSLVCLTSFLYIPIHIL